VAKVNRRTVDLSGYPDLVVIYLGMRVNALTGLKTLLGFGPKIATSVDAAPHGLLLHENIIYSLFPPHAGMRQYWRDFESLEAWARSEPHRAWWKEFLRDSGGTGFWHETYFMRGGMEAVYDDIHAPLGLLKFAPSHEARGPMFSARQRAGRVGSPTSIAPLSESDLDANEG
jgi:Monooxygenase af470-like